jgi:hypothetical protein
MTPQRPIMSKMSEQAVSPQQSQIPSSPLPAFMAILNQQQVPTMQPDFGNPNNGSATMMNADQQTMQQMQPGFMKTEWHSQMDLNL